ncbi:MAG: hypothetical protein KAH44_24810 [Oricola sp.]|nr:hypothetical protein [Oricola sp.]
MRRGVRVLAENARQQPRAGNASENALRKRPACRLAESAGETSNSLTDLKAIFETLADWEEQLQAQNIDFEELSP